MNYLKNIEKFTLDVSATSINDTSLNEFKTTFTNLHRLKDLSINLA